MAKVQNNYFSPNRLILLVIVFLCVAFWMNFDGRVAAVFLGDWVNAATAVLVGYLILELVLFVTSLAYARRRFSIAWLLLLAAAVGVVSKMHVERQQTQKDVATIREIGDREWTSKKKLRRKMVDYSLIDQATPLQFSDIGGQTVLTGLNFDIEEDLGCGCCFGTVTTAIDENELKTISRIRHLEDLCVPHSSITDAGLKSLSGMRHLKSLDISFNQISDEGLMDLRNLPNLEKLKIADTSISDAGTVDLNRFGNLRFLDLSSTLVSDACFADLANCERLEELRFRNSAITGAELGQLNRLRDLKRIDGGVDPGKDEEGRRAVLEQIAKSHHDSLVLKDLANLEDVGLSLFPIFDSIRFENLEHVKVINLFFLACPHQSVNSGSGLPTGERTPSTCEECQQIANELSFKDLPNLESIRLYDPGAVCFSNTPNLRDVSFNAVHDERCFRHLADLEHLEELPSVQILSISGTNLNDASLAMLRSFPGLKRLNIQGGSFSSAGLQFLSHCKQLEVLNLETVEGSGETLRVLNELKELKSLRISAGSIGELRLEGLKKLSEFYVGAKIDSLALKGLDSLHHLQFGGDQTIKRVSLSNLPGLRCLNIYPSSVAPLEFVELEGLPNLQTLRLASLKSNAHVNDEALKNLATFENLRDLNLENSQVTAGLLSAINQLRELERLILHGTEIESSSKLRK